MSCETEKPLKPSPTLPSLSRNHDDPVLSSAALASTSAESLQSDTIRPTQYPPAFARWMIVIALLLGEFLIALDLTIVATAIPRITDDYQTIRDVGWYGSGYFLTFAAFQSAWGKVFKYFNMKYAFFTSVVIFSVGSLVCALAPTSMSLIVGRALTGVGAAGVTNGVYTIIACIVPPAQVAMYLALVGMDFSIASVAGPLLGGVFTEKLSWRWCFWINLPIGGASLAVVLFFFKVPITMAPAEASMREKLLQMDLQGTVLLLSSLVCYMLALEEGGVRRPWNSSVIIGLLVGFVVLAVLFGFDQWLQGDRAQLVGRIMKRRTIAGLCAFIVFCNGTVFLMMYYLPIYFQSIGGASPSSSGFRSLPLILAMSIALLVSSATITRIGYYTPLLIMGGVLLTVGSGLIYTLDIGTSTGKYVGYQILVGAGNGICSQIPLITAIAFSEPEDIAITTALVLFYQLVSGALSVSLAQSVFTNTLLKRLPDFAPTIDPASVIAVGASKLREAFSAEDLPGILRAYMVGLKAAWGAATALGGLTFLCAFVPKIKSIKTGTNRGGTAIAV